MLAAHLNPSSWAKPPVLGKVFDLPKCLISPPNIPGTAQGWPVILGSIYFLYHNCGLLKFAIQTHSHAGKKWKRKELK